MRLRYLELAELAEVSRYLARYLCCQRAKNQGFIFRYLDLVEVPKYLAKYLGWQRAKILGFRFRYLELA